MATILKFLQLFLVIAPILAAQLDIDFISFTVDPENNSVAKAKLTVEKANKTIFKVSGVFDQLNDMDDEYSIEPAFYFSADSEQFIKLTHIPKTGVCAMMQGFYKHRIYEKLIQACKNAPNPDTCPVPAAKYEIIDYHLDIRNFQGVIVEGSYKIEVAIYKGDNLEVTFSAVFKAIYS